MTDHRQVLVRHGRQSAEVDEGLAALILALWRRGYRTFSSCEGQPDTDGSYRLGSPGPVAWIAFTTERQARMVAKHVGGHCLRPQDDPGFKPASDDPFLDYPNGATVGFPASDIESVLAAVRGKAAVVVGKSLPAKPKKLERAPRDEWAEMEAA